MRRFALVFIACMLLTPSLSLADSWTLVDPKGDDKGPGSYVYPTAAEYKLGSFDITEVVISEDGDDVVFEVSVKKKIEDPWNSKDWGGNGFSLQFAQVYIDTDHKAGSGHTDSLPGINIRFPPESAWDKVVLLSPQGKTRLRSEINSKAGALKADVVVPRSTRARGKTLKAVVSRKDLGSAPLAGWGVQVVMQSNEGYPSGRDLLTRKINEYEGKHRFGGGNDYDCDPHVLDILAGAAKGDPAEVKAQHAALAHQCDPGGDPAKSTLAVVPMVYR